jgi:hypothetical protein
MATTTTNFGWDIPQSTDLVKDGATAIAALGQDIDTAFIDLKGGTTGQVLAKASNTDLDYSWVAQDDSNAIQNAIVDAKGDLIAATAADTPARLAVGTNGHVLTADSTAATGIKWAAAAGGGKVLQVVQVNPSTTFTSTSGTMVDATNYTASITPTLATSKVLVIFDFTGYVQKNSSTYGLNWGQILRGATVVYGSDTIGMQVWDTASSFSFGYQGRTNYVYLDSPATTSSTTYKLQVSVDASGTVSIKPPASITLMEIGA